MNFRVLYTDTAKQDLREIAIYIAEQSKEKETAKRFVNELREKTKVLETFPESGAVPNDRILKSQGYRFLVHKDYLIFYHYNEQEKTSYILSVFHAKRDYVRVMRKLI